MPAIHTCSCHRHPTLSSCKTSESFSTCLKTVASIDKGMAGDTQLPGNRVCPQAALQNGPELGVLSQVHQRQATLLLSDQAGGRCSRLQQLHHSLLALLPTVPGEDLRFYHQCPSLNPASPCEPDLHSSLGHNGEPRWPMGKKR